MGGWTEVYDGLTFATVRGAGHEVPLFQPRRAFILFQSFLGGKELPRSWQVWRMVAMLRRKDRMQPEVDAIHWSHESYGTSKVEQNSFISICIRTNHHNFIKEMTLMRTIYLVNTQIWWDKVCPTLQNQRESNGFIMAMDSSSYSSPPIHS